MRILKVKKFNANIINSLNYRNSNLEKVLNDPYFIGRYKKIFVFNTGGYILI